MFLIKPEETATGKLINHNESHKIEYLPPHHRGSGVQYLAHGHFDMQDLGSQGSTWSPSLTTVAYILMFNLHLQKN